MSGTVLAFCSSSREEAKVRTLRSHSVLGETSDLGLRTVWSNGQTPPDPGTHQNACAKSMGRNFLVIHGVSLVAHDEWKEGL